LGTNLPAGVKAQLESNAMDIVKAHERKHNYYGTPSCNPHLGNVEVVENTFFDFV